MMDEESTAQLRGLLSGEPNAPIRTSLARSYLLLKALEGTRSWLMLMVIVVLVVLGLFVLMVLGTVLFGGAMVLGLFPLGFLFVVTLGLPVLFMLDYTSRVGRFLRSGKAEHLLRVLAAQRRLWTTLGVLSILGSCGLLFHLIRLALVVMESPHFPWH